MNAETPSLAPCSTDVSGTRSSPEVTSMRSPTNVPVRKPRRFDDPPSSRRSYGGSVASVVKYCTRPATTDCRITRRYPRASVS